MEWVDENVPELGYHEYTIVAINEVGEGERAYLNRYIGPDVPAKVTDLAVKKIEGCASVELSWTGSEGGENGSYADASKLTYTVVRYPDSAVLAEGLKETSFTDLQIEELKAYTYGIQATNEIGFTEVVSESVVAGPALDPASYQTDFSGNAFGDYWISDDANGDGWSWMACSVYGTYAFGEYWPAAEYFINPGLHTTATVRDADDYLLSPPFLFKGGMGYKLSFDYRCLSEEQMKITFGTINSSAAQTEVQELELLPSDPEVEFGYMEVDLPSSPSDRIGVVGLDLVTPLNDLLYSFLQITNLKISETGAFSNEEDGLLDDARVLSRRDGIHIDGNFERVEVYNVSGQKMAEGTESDICTESWPQGVYLVRLVAGTAERVFKVVVFN